MWPDNINNSDLEYAPPPDSGVASRPIGRPVDTFLTRSKKLLHFDRYAIVVAGFAFVFLIGVCAAFAISYVRSQKNSAARNGENYPVSDIRFDRSNFTDFAAIERATALTVNGQLSVQKSLVLSPTDQPGQAAIGQVYFDKATNAPFYYNGNSFVSLKPSQSVTDIQGANGSVTLGEGLQLNNQVIGLDDTVLRSSAPRVNSLQGSTGDVVLTGGRGVIVNGTTISSSGILSIFATNGMVVSQSNGVATIGLPQSLSANSSPTFNALSLSNALGVGSGGTGLDESDLLGNSLLITSETGGSYELVPATVGGQCLISDADDNNKIKFGSCSGAPSSGVTTMGSLETADGNKDIRGARIIGSSLYMQEASASFAGLVTTASQTFAGNKTFNGNVTVAAGSQLVLGNYAGAACTGKLITDNTGRITCGTDQVGTGDGMGVSSVGALDGGTPNANGASISNDFSTIYLQSAAATRSGIVTTAAQTFAGLKTFNSGATIASGQNLTLGMACSGGQVLTTNASGVVTCVTDTVGSGDGVGATTVGALDGGTPNANGATISGTTMYLQSASATQNGIVTTGAQTFAGVKTFNTGLTVANSQPLTLLEFSTGGANGGACTGKLITNAAGRIVCGTDNVGTGDGVGVSVLGTLDSQIKAAAGATIFNNAGTLTLALQTADATNPGLVSAAAQTFGGLKTFNGGISVASSADLYLGVYAGAACTGKLITDNTGRITCGTDQVGGGDGVGVTTIGAIDSQAKSANGASITGSNLYLQTADATNPGLVSTAAQTFAGAKTFNGGVVVAGQQTIRFVGGSTAQRPASPSEGTLYYDTDSKTVVTYANGKWQGDGKDTILVAANNSSQKDRDAADYVTNGDTGAANDGDQVEINQAITAAAGKKVLLLPGTYTVDAQISISIDNTVLMGVGNASRIELADLDSDVNIINKTGFTSNVTIRDLMIEGRKELNTSGQQYGIFVSSGDSTTDHTALIDNVTVQNVRNGSVWLDLVSNNVIVRGSTFKASNTYGIYTRGSNSVIANNSFYSNAGMAIRLDAGSSHHTIIGNNIRANGHGIDVSGTASNHTISGNTISDSTGNGINLSSTSTGFNITGNTISNTSGFGIGTYGNDHLISSNNIVATGGSSVLLGGPNNIISNNIFRNAGGSTNNNAITFSNASANPTNNQIIGNRISDTSATSTNIAINIIASATGTILADNNIVTGTVTDASGATVYNGQTSTTGNYLIQPAGSGTIELLKNTNVTGSLAVSGTISTGGTQRISSTGALSNVSIGSTQGIVITSPTTGMLTTLSSAGATNKCLGYDGSNFVWSDCSGSGGGSTGYANGGNNFTTNGGNAVSRINTSYDQVITNPVLGLTSNSALDLITNNISRINIANDGKIKVLSNSGNSDELFVVRTQYTGSSANQFNTLRVDTLNDNLGRVGIGLPYAQGPEVRLDIGGNSSSLANTANGGVQIWASAAPAVSHAGVNGGSSLGSGRIYFDQLTGKFKVSENGGSYVDLIQGTGAVPSFLTNGNAVTADATLGTTNNYGLSVITNGNTRLTIDNQGDARYNVNNFFDFMGAGVTPIVRVDKNNSSLLIGTTTAVGGAGLNVSSAINATAYKVGGVNGVSLSCGSGTQALGSFDFTGGILTSGSCSANNSDLAEAYNSSDNLAAGELVMAAGTSATDVKRATAASANGGLMGIVSTAPSQTIGTAQVPNGYPIALSGRVPTKVNGEGGPIAVGDKITISSVAGVGKKATHRGMIVGTAVESFNGVGEGSIEVFVNLTYYQPSDSDVLQAQTATIGDLNVSGTATIQNLTVSGVLTVKNIVVGGHIITASGQPTAELEVNAGELSTVTVEGNDTTGTITIVTGSQPEAGDLVRLTFSEVYGKAPRVILSASNSDAADLNFFKNETTTEMFALSVKEQPQANTTYKFDYFIAE